MSTSLIDLLQQIQIPRKRRRHTKLERLRIWCSYADEITSVSAAAAIGVPKKMASRMLFDLVQEGSLTLAGKKRAEPGGGGVKKIWKWVGTTYADPPASSADE